MTTRKRRITVGCLVGLGLLIAFACLAGWRLWHVRADLVEAKASATALEAALAAKDPSGSRAALEDLQTHSRAASQQTEGLVWSAMSATPVLGHEAEIVRVLSQSLDDLSHEGLEPLVEIVKALDQGEFAPQNGRIPVARIEELQPAVAASHRVFERSSEALAGLEPSSIAQLEAARQQLDEVVAQGLQRISTADTAVQLVPAMLGADEERRYLLVLQNNAEIRSSGGFPGSVFLLKADEGRIDLTQPAAGNSFPILSRPALPLTDAEKSLFPTAVGTRFVDANKIPDFPRAADLWTARWEERSGTRLDGVVSADPVLLSYLLEGRTSLQVGGVELNSSNVVSELLQRAYARLAPTEQDAFFRDVGLAAFRHLMVDADPQRLLTAVRRGADESRVLVRASRENEDDMLRGAGLSGQMVHEDVPNPQMGVYLNDATGHTGSKMSYYLDYQATVTAEACRDQVQSLRGRLDLSLNTPDPTTLPHYVTGGSEEVPLGAEGLEVYLVGPLGGSLENVQVDGAPVKATVVDYDGRPSIRVEFQLGAGEQSRVTWRMQSGSGQTGDIQVAVTPSVQPGVKSSTVTSGC